MENKKRDYLMLVRISEDKFIDSLQKEGQIYCNPIKYFRSIEDNGLRGDQNEGKFYLKQAEDLTIMIGGKVTANAKRTQLYFGNNKYSGNIYCLYGVDSSLVDMTKETRQKVFIENGSKDFGKRALLITYPEEFMNRIETVLKGLSQEYNFQTVNYYDSTTYQGELSPFYKSNKYRYQNEVRLWIPNGKEGPFEFFIGDISDISCKIPVRDLDNIWVKVLRNAHNK